MAGSVDDGDADGSATESLRGSTALDEQVDVMALHLWTCVHHGVDSVVEPALLNANHGAEREHRRISRDETASDGDASRRYRAVTVGGCNEGHRHRCAWRVGERSSRRAALHDSEKDGSQDHLRSAGTSSTCVPGTLRPHESGRESNRVPRAACDLAGKSSHEGRTALTILKRLRRSGANRRTHAIGSLSCVPPGRRAGGGEHHRPPPQSRARASSDAWRAARAGR